jgi:hypothetical protein
MLSQKHPGSHQIKLAFNFFPYTFKLKNDHASKNRRKLVAFTTTKANFIQQETSLETPVMSNNDRPTVPDGSLTIKRLYKAIILKAVTHKSNPLLGKSLKTNLSLRDINDREYTSSSLLLVPRFFHRSRYWYPLPSLETRRFPPQVAICTEWVLCPSTWKQMTSGKRWGDRWRAVTKQRAVKWRHERENSCSNTRNMTPAVSRSSCSYRSLHL